MKTETFQYMVMMLLWLIVAKLTDRSDILGAIAYYVAMFASWFNLWFMWRSLFTERTARTEARTDA